MYNCALCSIHACNKMELDKTPKNCPSLDEKIKEINEIYKEKENLKIAKASALVVSEGYCEKTRIEEIIDFANRCEFEKLGIAFCIGLSNEAKTDLNILLGLCVGHDSLFIKYSEAPITIFAVKDRVLAHNPLGAIYQAESYYKDKLFPPK